MNINLSLVDQQVQEIANRNEDLDSDSNERISKAFTLLYIKNNLDIEDEEAKEYIYLM